MEYTCIRMIRKFSVFLLCNVSSKRLATHANCYIMSAYILIDHDSAGQYRYGAQQYLSDNAKRLALCALLYYEY